MSAGNTRIEAEWLLKLRCDAEVALSEAKDASPEKLRARVKWQDANAALIELLSPHKIGDIAEYTLGGKRRCLRVEAVVVARLIQPTTRIGDPHLIEDMRLSIRGTAVRRDGTLGTQSVYFNVEFADLLK